MNLTFGTISVIVLAMAIGAFVKGATGQGLPQIAIPVMATFLGVTPAVVIMAIPGIVTNTWILWTLRAHLRETRDLPAILSTGTLGAVAGTVLLDSLDENVLSLTLAGLIGIYVVLFFLHPDLRLSERFTRVASPPVGLAAGVLQGATGVSGPLVSTYLHGYRLPKQVYVVAITTVFQVFALVQAITLLAIGLYTGDLFALSLLSLLPIMALLPLGARFTERLSPRAFDLIVIGLLSATAIKLVYDALG